MKPKIHVEIDLVRFVVKKEKLCLHKAPGWSTLMMD